jgi:hypothetical protein
MSGDKEEGYRAAVALMGARLRGDAVGEQAFAGDCCAGCRPLLDGMLKVAEIAIKAIAEHARVAPSEAAEILDYHLWRMSRDAR